VPSWSRLLVDLPGRTKRGRPSCPVARLQRRNAVQLFALPRPSRVANGFRCRTPRMSGSDLDFLRAAERRRHGGFAPSPWPKYSTGCRSAGMQPCYIFDYAQAFNIHWTRNISMALRTWRARGRWSSTTRARNRDGLNKSETCKSPCGGSRYKVIDGPFTDRAKIA